MISVAHGSCAAQHALAPDAAAARCAAYMARYRQGLAIERAAVAALES